MAKGRQGKWVYSALNRSYKYISRFNSYKNKIPAPPTAATPQLNPGMLAEFDDLGPAAWVAVWSATMLACFLSISLYGVA